MKRRRYEHRCASHIAAAVIVVITTSTTLVAQQPAAPADAKPPVAASVELPPVPDGDAAALFAYIERVKKIDPPAGDVPAVVAHLIKVHTAVLAALDKIEKAGAQAGEAEQTRVVADKLTSMQLLRRLEAPGAAEKMQQYLTQLSADKRPFVPPLAKIYQLAGRLQELDRNNPAEVEKLLADVREHVRSAKPDARNLAIALQTAMAAEAVGLVKQAAEAYIEFAAAFALSDDKQVVENSERLAGAARLLGLVGNPIELKGKALDGKPFDAAKLKGKVVLVDFWATWCGPCLADMPSLRAAYKAYHERGFEIVGISLDDDAARLKAFIEREELPWTILTGDDAATSGWNHPSAVHYGILSIPRAVLIDRDGKVVSIAAHGEALWELLAKQIGPVEEPKPEDAKPGEAKPADGAKPAEK